MKNKISDAARKRKEYRPIGTMSANEATVQKSLWAAKKRKQRGKTEKPKNRVPIKDMTHE